ncbi:hypothetical protein [Amycolatopsis vastitatis]|uniref:Uncharacterized protein n=1 Tax=Amycolatopsis vastitatis TaxID=1905142 RepID=A0A229SJW6_9PSEU|nr:hypothetical protein [Amycolatopsis vastitatis]OXM59120.1 hypothetical protein CF165_49330 [Amycolatopsis vastitatis]
MHKARTAAAAMAITATALAAGAATAEAAPAPPASPATAQADGYFYTYNGTGFTDFCGRWSGPSSYWGACANQDESLWNNGYPGALDDVLIYWGRNQTGAWRGVCNGNALSNVSGLTFDYSGGASGHGEPIWHNIASHRWATLGGACA